LSSSTAWRNETPLSFITQSMGPPPTPQPKQCHRFLAGVTIRLAVSSAWNGQWPAQALQLDAGGLDQALHRHFVF
jgi:hypothetical protein